ncbi:MAG: beta family protein [Cetobacterium sp.]
MNKYKYAPILKANRGEFNGFLDLKNEHQEEIFPIFEVTIPKLETEKQKNKISTKLNTLETRLLKFDRKIGITFGEHQEFITKIISQNKNLIPIFSNAIDFFNCNLEKKVLRIKIPVLFDETDIEDILCGLKEENILLFDLDDISEKSIFRNSYTELIKTLNILKERNIENKIIISVSSFPSGKDITNQKMLTIEMYKKEEIKLYLKLLEDFKELDLVYSDYAITKYTDIELPEHFNPNIIPEKLKYTLENNYIVFKGENKKEEVREKTPARKLAEDFIKTEYFKGEDFTIGSKNMVQFAKSSTNGNAEKLIRIGTTHHLELILKQLSQDS